ncbi:hypothetical protein F5879DRAFT_993293 [Lentinula edodes]|nr:hypothetical protein F5879DRAFT_993293 [Lentinula edodes]
MSASRTITTTTNTCSSPAAGPSNLPATLPTPRTASGEDNDQDEEEIMRRALAMVQRVKKRKAEAAVKKKRAEEEAARKNLPPIILAPHGTASFAPGPPGSSISFPASTQPRQYTPGSHVTVTSMPWASIPLLGTLKIHLLL